MFFMSTIFDILVLHTKRKKCGQMGPTLCYLQSQVCLHAKVLGLYLHFFSGKVSFIYLFIIIIFFGTEWYVAI